MERLVDQSAKHQYAIEYSAKSKTGETVRGIILVDANTRTIAAAKVRRSGYVVLSVNMVG